MKYIKCFENKKIFFKNDIVKISDNDAASLPYVKILKRYKRNDIPIDQYHVELLYPNEKYWAYEKNEINTIYIPDYLILYKLSKKDFDELKMKNKVNKYNL
jgi:hypothetical protein